MTERAVNFCDSPFWDWDTFWNADVPISHGLLSSHNSSFRTRYVSSVQTKEGGGDEFVHLINILDIVFRLQLFHISILQCSKSEFG
ncbi:hypothetical protein TNIN_129991 [Trichonephila inaurata madagascariensis]|uniref:Uncharacterized protein n=1 Tax=Trichonephila inaurata madagascariensis TaxID=2747483 RepID=A0A8X7BXX1_9ARAC|nr:hypothetical protein TNIN_129991 [Trichonephila inaurata madagascariensis]